MKAVNVLGAADRCSGLVPSRRRVAPSASRDSGSALDPDQSPEAATAASNDPLQGGHLATPGLTHDSFVSLGNLRECTADRAATTTHARPADHEDRHFTASAGILP